MSLSRVFLLAVWLAVVLLGDDVACESSPESILNDMNDSQQDINKVVWWKKTNFYHIYIRSFRDSDGDGQGDLRGVIEKLDYLKMIGVETLLMAPFYESTMHDGGYDITNHTAINPTFGTMKDYEDLLAGLKERNMRILIDFVPNHVSHEHKWFKLGRQAPNHCNSSECLHYMDFFLWTNSTRFNGSLPSNWLSIFGAQPAWTRDKVKNEFYLHQFLPEQPDLNLSNPFVREELKQIVRFWLSKGVDGIRIDAVPFFFEDWLEWRDEPPNEHWKQGDPCYYCKLDHKYTFNYKGTAELVKDWYDLAQNEFEGDRLTINEAYMPAEDLVKYHGSSPTNRYTDQTFAFDLFNLRRETMSPEEIVKNSMVWYNATRSLGWPNERRAGTIEPWPLWCMGNHDQSRRINLVGEENFDAVIWIGFMLHGSPVMYYGDELGSWNANPDDVPAKTLVEGESGRLVQRALMAWSPGGPSAGFSNTSDNWMCLARNYKTFNVKTQLESPKSHLRNFIDMQRLRKDYLETFVFGELFLFRVSPKSSRIYNLARVHKRFGSLLFVYNTNPSECASLLMLEDADKPLPPNRGRIILLNYERSRKLDLLCNQTTRLQEGDEVSLVDLALGPSQAAVIRYY